MWVWFLIVALQIPNAWFRIVNRFIPIGGVGSLVAITPTVVIAINDYGLGLLGTFNGTLHTCGD